MLALPELLVSAQIDGAALVNSTAQTSLLPTAARATMPANLISRVGLRMLIQAAGRITTTATPGSLTFDLKLGSVVIGSSGGFALNTAAQTNVNWRLHWEFTLRAIGGVTTANFFHQGAWFSHAVVGAAAPTAGGTGVHLIPFNAAPAVGTGFDSTAAAILDLFATWQTASANNSIQLHQYDVLILNA
mgnify:CR=1 FL=1